MNITNSYSNLLKGISVVTLISSPYAIANNLTTEIAHTITLANYTVKKVITGDIKNVVDTSRNFSVTSFPLAIADDFPAPRTEIARKLLDHRRKALARGIKFLTADEINLMVKERRGDFS